MDPLDLVEASEVLSKIPSTFNQDVRNTKWKVRKEAVDSVESILNKPKLESGDYSELVSGLEHVIEKDKNVMVVAVAAKCVTHLASGLGEEFSSSARTIVPPLLSKLKEKKPTVLNPVTEALNTINDNCVSFTEFTENIVETSKSRVPALKVNLLDWLEQSLSKTTRQGLGSSAKPLTEAFVPLVDDSNGDVRNNATKCLGRFMWLVGERACGPLLERIDKIKAEKVKEYYQTLGPSPSAPQGTGRGENTKTKPKPGNAKQNTTNNDGGNNGGMESSGSRGRQAAPGRGRGRGRGRGQVQGASGGGRGRGRGKTQGATSARSGNKKQGNATDDGIDIEVTVNEEEVMERAEALIPSNTLGLLRSKKWKERVEGMDNLRSYVFDLNDLASQADLIVRMLSKLPGFKDSNFQVLSSVFQLIADMGEEVNGLPRPTAALVVPGAAEKIGDTKVKTAAQSCLTSLCRSVGPQFVFARLYRLLEKQRNVKNIAEGIEWMGTTVTAFGISTLKAPALVQFSKKMVEHTNPRIKSSTIRLLCEMKRQVGDALLKSLQDIKPALLSSIEKEFENTSIDQPEPTEFVKGAEPPKKSRSKTSSAQSGRGGESTVQDMEVDDEDGGHQGNNDYENDDYDDDDEMMEGDDLMPRKNISGQLNRQLLQDLDHEKGKKRNEALKRIEGIIVSAGRHIEPVGLDAIMPILKKRLGESNKVVVISAARVVGMLGEAGGSGMSNYIKILGPVLSNISDNKKSVRDTVLTTLNQWYQQIGLVPMLKPLCRVVSADNPVGREEVLRFLCARIAEQRQPPPSGTLTPLVQPLVAALQDRNAEVRRLSERVLEETVTNVGPDAFYSATRNLKPAIAKSVNDTIDKHTNTQQQSQQQPQQQHHHQQQQSQQQHQNQFQTHSSKQPSSQQQSQPPTQQHNHQHQHQDPQSGFSNTTSSSSQSSSILVSNNLKDMRSKQERRHRWADGGEPRQEVVELLKEQMMNCVSPDIHRLLFASDFKKQNEAIGQISAAMHEQQREMIENMDVLLKWASLRIFEANNTSQLSKTIQFVRDMFRIARDTGYGASDYEASVLFPFLCERLGHNQERLRHEMRSIISTACEVYPPEKVMVFLLKGLDSRNARSRCELLESMNDIVQRYGVQSVPSLPKAVRVIGQRIGDRDASVRGAALSLLGAMFPMVGAEEMWKYLDRLDPQHRDMLEERLRHLGGGQSVKGAEVDPAPMEIEQHHQPPQEQQAVSQQQQYETNFDQQQISENKPMHINNSESQFQASHFAQDQQMSQNSNLYQNQSYQNQQQEQHQRQQPPSNVYDESAQKIMALVDSLDANRVEASISSVRQLSALLSEGPAVSVGCCVDTILPKLALALEAAFYAAYTNEQAVRLCKYLLNTLMQVFSRKEIVQQSGSDAISVVVDHLLLRLLDGHLPHMDSGERLLTALNTIMLKVLENSDRTASFSALLQLLTYKAPEQGFTHKYTELVVKCLIKLTKTLPGVINRIRIDRLLYDLHRFLMEHPPSRFQDMGNANVPLRTVKTILNEVVNLCGPDIRQYLSMIPTQRSPLIISYIELMLSSRGSSGGTGSERKQDANQYPHLNRQQSSQPTRHSADSTGEFRGVLDSIFEKVRTTEHTQEGLLELHQFTMEHPDVPLDYHMSRCSGPFQSYIRRQLQKLARSQSQPSNKTYTRSFPNTDPHMGNQTGVHNHQNSQSNMMSRDEGNGKGSVGMYQEQLSQLKQNYGYSDGGTASGDNGSDGSSDMSSFRSRLAYLKRQ